jgi:hypothetical protein
VTIVLSSTAIAERALRDRKPSERRPSQRELVAWSLLRCPDDRPPRG